MDADQSRLNALVVLDKQRKKKALLRRSYLKKVRCARQSYKPEDVLAAMHAIWRGMSRRQAAKVFNIPRSTLLDKLDGKRPVDASPGPNPFLTKAEERTLESWAIDLYHRGFPLKTEDLKDMAQAVVQNSQRRTSFRNGRPGRSWMRNFLLRHPKMYEISSDMVPGPRRSRTVTTREEARQWCQQHLTFMSSLGLESVLDFPNRIFSVDHGEFLFDSATGYLIEQDRSDKVEEREHDVSDNSELSAAGGECVSIVATFSAAGKVAPLMFVYPFKDQSQDIFSSFPPSCVGTFAEGGLLTAKVFLDYLVSFHQWLRQENVPLPVLLLVDGRRSRLNMDVTHFCEENGIVLYCLFPTPRPAIAEIISSVFHDSLSEINKFNLPSRLTESLSAENDSGTSRRSENFSILPHLQTMLQTLIEVRSQQKDIVPCFTSSLTSRSSLKILGGSRNFGEAESTLAQNDFSDGEFDELTPIEGEIEMIFDCSENSDPYDPYLLALHPALQAGAQVPSYLIFELPVKEISSQNSVPPKTHDDSIEDRVDQPDVNAPLIVKPLSSPLYHTDRGIAKVESEINDVLGSILSLRTSHLEDLEKMSPYLNPTEEPFLGFSPNDPPSNQKKFGAHGCLRFMENFLTERGLLEDFKSASCQRQWEGFPEAKILFDLWLAACDES